ncbi:MAG: aminopeptidase [Ruminococcaceae bacterium]|nr:aminopeptidase [Oscillospiraceae bacterium]
MKLTYSKENGFNKLEKSEQDFLFEFCEEYRNYLNKAKTEREFCTESYKLLEEEGFVALETVTKLSAGDKVYSVNRGKGIFAAVIGEAPLSEGINLVGAHIDAPRLDLKPSPLYEDGGLAYFKTHYYGGIKKFQWLTIPLSIHGIIVKTDGTQIKVNIGDNEDDPVFCISDILPHLGQEQAKKPLGEAVPGELLNVILGNIEADDAEKEKVKYNVLKYLNAKYDVTEEDLLSSEIEIVPAYPARDLGFDRSMIAGYGHDDRVCAYTALRALIDAKSPEKTAVCLLVDKEEIGSMGCTGMQSRYFENVLAKICYLKENNVNDMYLRNVLSNSSCLSADVGAAFDPNFPETTERNNTPFLNHGILLTKYTGSRGKSGASDANAEFVAKIRNLFEKNGVLWQIGELGKVDAGGGGTIAQFVANLDMEVIDCGVPLLSMHSPYEIAGKIDIYMAYKGYKAFMES